MQTSTSTMTLTANCEALRRYSRKDAALSKYTYSVAKEEILLQPLSLSTSSQKAFCFSFLQN